MENENIVTVNLELNKDLEEAIREIVKEEIEKNKTFAYDTISKQKPERYIYNREKIHVDGKFLEKLFRINLAEKYKDNNSNTNKNLLLLAKNKLDDLNIDEVTDIEVSQENDSYPDEFDGKKEYRITIDITHRK